MYQASKIDGVRKPKSERVKLRLYLRCGCVLAQYADLHLILKQAGKHSCPMPDGK